MRSSESLAGLPADRRLSAHTQTEPVFSLVRTNSPRSCSKRARWDQPVRELGFLARQRRYLLAQRKELLARRLELLAKRQNLLVRMTAPVFLRPDRQSSSWGPSPSSWLVDGANQPTSNNSGEPCSPARPPPRPGPRRPDRPCAGRHGSPRRRGAPGNRGWRRLASPGRSSRRPEARSW